MLNALLITLLRFRLRQVSTLAAEEAIVPKLFHLLLNELFPQLRDLVANLASELLSDPLHFIGRFHHLFKLVQQAVIILMTSTHKGLAQ